MYKVKSGTDIKPLDNQRTFKNDLVPRLPFSMMICGSKSAGKSSLLLNMLLSKDLLAGKFNKIIYISPTASMDKKVRDLEGTKNLTAVNYRLINQMKKLRKKQRIFAVDDFDEEYTTSNIEFYDEIDMNMIEELQDYQKQIINIFDKGTADNLLLILDDTASSKIWKNIKFIKMLFNSRHTNLSLIITTQTYNSISKPIRLNNSILVLFETANQKELENIHLENKSQLNFKEFLEVCKNVFDIPFNFLVMNYQNDRSHRLQNQFKSFIEY